MLRGIFGLEDCGSMFEYFFLEILLSCDITFAFVFLGGIGGLKSQVGKNPVGLTLCSLGQLRSLGLLYNNPPPCCCFSQMLLQDIFQLIIVSVVFTTVQLAATKFLENLVAWKMKC